MSVVHCKRERYDVYIGRGCCPQTGEFGRWGNPFRIGRDGDRDQVIKLYRIWLSRQLTEGDIDLYELAALHGKTLGCWCAPQRCHGEVLVKAAEWAHENAAKRHPRPNQNWCVGCSPEGEGDTTFCCGCGIPFF